MEVSIHYPCNNMQASMIAQPALKALPFSNKIHKPNASTMIDTQYTSIQGHIKKRIALDKSTYHEV